MNLQDAYDRITYDIGTPDDTTGHAINPIVTNKALLAKLMDQMRSYANITKGIQSIYSYPIDHLQTAFIPAPSLALRSQPYFYAFIVSQGTIFPCDIRGPRDVYPIFRYNPIQGLTNWIMPWHDGHNGYLSFFPMKNLACSATTLNGAINSSVTTITVVSASAFISNNGRITIETEKILYGRKDATNFYDCVRGVEGTTAASHLTAAAVKENNLQLLYSRLPVAIAAESDDSISAANLALILEPVDEHMEGIIKATTYNLLLKIDLERAAAFKVDSQELFEQYAVDIRKGYARKFGANIRQPYPVNEMSTPFGGNLIY